MRLTQQTSYSIRVLLYCAANTTDNSRIRDIAATYGISELHLFKIMHVLVEGGFVETIRGRNGGIRLARPASEITIGAVVRATESNFFLTDCFDTTNRDCPLVDACGVNRILSEAPGPSSRCSTATPSPMSRMTAAICAACSISAPSRRGALRKRRSRCTPSEDGAPRRLDAGQTAANTHCSLQGGEDSMDLRDVLGRISLFSDALTRQQLAELAARCRMATYTSGMVVMNEGDFGGFMLAIVAGRLGVTTGSGRDRRQIATLGPGEIVGEMALLTGARRAATVTALETTMAVEISKVALETMFRASPELLDRLGALLAERRARFAGRERQQESRTGEIIEAMRRLFG